MPAGRAEGEVRDRGSRFLALIEPVEDEQEARAALAATARRFPDATHHCWALRVGSPPRERSSDAGEPAGTAGVPILRVLQGAGLSGALAVVVRWFGGTKLGKGGLARAYAAAAREALAGLEIVERPATAEVAVEVAFERVGAVKRLLRPPEVELAREEYGGERARLVLRVAEERRDALEEALAELGARPVPGPAV